MWLVAETSAWQYVHSKSLNNIARGSEYDHLLKEFLERGGDLSSCPFDAGEYRYEGPELKDLVGLSNTLR